MLSALSAVNERVQGLRSGDDYLAKPFALEELPARLEALLRRPVNATETVLHVGPLELDLVGRHAHRGRRYLELLPREFQLLEYMMRREGQVLTRAMLLQDVWKYHFVARTNLADVHIGRLRRKVDPSGAAAPAHEIPAALEENLFEEPWRIKLGGLFAANYRSGNIERLSPDFPLDSAPHTTRLIRIGSRGREPHTVRATGRRLPSGDIVMVAQDIAELRELAKIVSRALAVGLAPALGLAVALGVWLSLRAQQRIQGVSDQVERIVAGELRERLPSRGFNEPVDRLAVIVNHMLDEIERLVRELAGVGNDIAHDLRRPLTRVRVILDRGREAGRSVGDFQNMTDRAIVGLDQALAIISALLRIAEIEHSARISGFRDVDLAGLLREVKEFYDPIAEDKAVSIALELAQVAPVTGNRELLLEAVANLVDNSVKFTPPGGLVRLRLFSQCSKTVVQVSDNGPGIRDAERAAVTKRFYRSDKSRNIPGVGLGLSLVSAIVRLHRFELVIGGRLPGCTIDIVCPT